MSKTFIDSHCHIHSVGPDTEKHTSAKWQELGLSPETVLKRANDAGVTKLICVGTDLVDSVKAVEFAQAHDSCYATIGIHPHEAKRYVKNKTALTQFKELVTKPKVVAIGECGLDYYYAHSDPSDQEKVLRFQLDLAREYDLPLSFHVREAYDDFWPIFDSYGGNLRGVLHSFTDSTATLKKALERGLLIGVNGIATFPSADTLSEMIKAVPDNHLLIETDSPYLTPDPYRGTINEPKQIVRIAEYLVELRQTNLEHLADLTSANANQLFGL